MSDNDKSKTQLIDDLKKATRRIIELENKSNSAFALHNLKIEKQHNAGLIELEKSEKRYRDMFRNIDNCVAIYKAVDDGADFIFLDINPAAEQTEQIKKEEIVGKRVTEIFPGVAKFGLLDVFSNVWKTGKPQRHPISMYNDNRIIGWRENLVCKLPSGEITAIYSDLTKKKQLEEDLRQREERYKNLSNLAYEGILIHENGVATDANESLVKMFGYQREEAIGKNILELCIPKKFNELITKKIQQQNSEPYEAMGQKKDGTLFPIEIEAKNVKDSKETSRVVAIRDITDRKRIEKEKTDLENQLLQAQKMESIGLLAGGVAHDFNNLLTIILSSCSLITNDLRKGDPLLNDLHHIESAGNRAAELTKQLLAFSRRQVLQTEVVDLNNIIENLDKMLRRLIGENIDMLTKPSPDLWKVVADSSQIEQIVMNLAVNARDAMPNGGNLTIKTANVELDEEYSSAHANVMPGSYVMLAVSDSGCGMNKKTTAQVFDPFFTTKDKDKGTGLGLSTVYGIVKQHGGNIWIYSEPDKGTIFKIYLPKTTAMEKTTSKSWDIITDLHGIETVLVVEDEKTLLKLVVQVLERKGYTVLQARDGLEGQTVANTHEGTIHLLLTDVVMPNISGKDMADKLKVTRPKLKVLYMSGYTDNAIVHHSVLDENTHFLQKPFGIKNLAQKVRQVLDYQDD